MADDFGKVKACLEESSANGNLQIRPMCLFFHCSVVIALDGRDFVLLRVYHLPYHLLTTCFTICSITCFVTCFYVLALEDYVPHSISSLIQKFDEVQYHVGGITAIREISIVAEAQNPRQADIWLEW